MILLLLCMISIYGRVYMCSLYLYILLGNRAPWKNSVTEWLTLYKYIWNKKIKMNKIYSDRIYTQTHTHIYIYIMRCNIETSQYNLQSIMYPIICILQKLHNNNGNKKHLYRNLVGARGIVWWYDHPRQTSTEKNDNIGKGWCFRFDYNEMHYNCSNVICWTNKP